MREIVLFLLVAEVEIRNNTKSRFLEISFFLAPNLPGLNLEKRSYPCDEF